MSFLCQCYRSGYAFIPVFFVVKAYSTSVAFGGVHFLRHCSCGGLDTQQSTRHALLLPTYKIPCSVEGGMRCSYSYNDNMGISRFLLQTAAPSRQQFHKDLIARGMHIAQQTIQMLF